MALMDKNGRPQQQYIIKLISLFFIPDSAGRRKEISDLGLPKFKKFYTIGISVRLE